MAARYRATAEARGVCVAPSLAYEIAPADWGAHEAAEAVGGSPDVLSIAYLLRPSRAGGYGVSTTRGTKRSALRMIADERPLQYVDGALAVEPIAEVRLDVEAESGRVVDAISFPSPEAVLVPLHTGARTVRTVMAAGKRASAILHGGRRAIPTLGRLTRALAERALARSPEGPTDDAREATFEIVIVAERAGRRAVTRVSGRDPYGLTAEIQATFARRILEGAPTGKGVVAPSQAIPAAEAFAALASTGLRRSTR
jgi:hypothetical protein